MWPHPQAACIAGDSGKSPGGTEETQLLCSDASTPRDSGGVLTSASRAYAVTTIAQEMQPHPAFKCWQSASSIPCDEGHCTCTA